MGAGLTVGAAYPDPPFNAMPDDTGLDIDLMTELAGALGESVKFVAYQDADGSGRGDFDGIFDRLCAGGYDCVATGVTVTPGRQRRAEFLAPYLISGQALAVDTGRLPHLQGVDDLAGLTLGVRRGDTGEPIAERLVADGKAARLRRYDYGAIGTAISDLSTGHCDAVMALAPVLTELVKKVQRVSPGVQVVQRGLSVEHIAIAVAPADQTLARRLRDAQAELEDDGTLQRIRRKWLGNPYLDQSLAAL
ncbi:MAG: ABC transporter substrate-binding protein [Actinomycetia bacterium]|nr:ABC transporter substrate-binding protein [Actinomycetes bacterium]MCH9710420.1 ABC transporter substrate-binding protein [Actinomycetes bacterium]MCH9767226.1 ABC transporter substrate-binding protein [Actinomycetes bacterium]